MILLHNFPLAAESASEGRGRLFFTPPSWYHLRRDVQAACSVKQAVFCRAIIDLSGLCDR